MFYIYALQSPFMKELNRFPTPRLLCLWKILEENTVGCPICQQMKFFLKKVEKKPMPLIIRTWVYICVLEIETLKNIP